MKGKMIKRITAAALALAMSVGVPFTPFHGVLDDMAITAWAEEPYFEFVTVTPTVDGGQTSNWDSTNENYNKLVDGDTGTKYGLSNNNPYVEFHYNNAITPKGYALWTANDSNGERNPQSWTIKAMNSGDEDWTVLTTVDNTGRDKLPMTNNTRTIFALNNSTAYTHFRFEATPATNGAFQLAELQFCTVSPASFIQYATINGVDSRYCNTGSTISITPTVTTADGTALTLGTDFTATLGSVNVTEFPFSVTDEGDYTLTITGTGIETSGYTGTQTISFSVVDCPEGLSIDDEYTKGQDGYYYVNMPSGKYPNPKTVTILDGFTSSFKVYDDGGKNNQYTIYSNSGFYHKIILKAPQGYKLQLTGMVQVYENNGRRAWLEVYDGTSENDSNRLGNEAYGNKTTSGENIGTLISEGENVTLVFKGYTDNVSKAGLNLTVSLIKDQNYNDITIDSVTGGSVVSNMESAKLHDVVTLTAIPTDDSYMLNSISVKDAEDNNIPLSNDMHWYSGTNTATFSMPGKAVTVTPVFTNNQTATEGGLIIAMPKNGNIDATHIPSSVQSFKVLYEYPNTAITGTSVLKLTVPDGYTMKLSGTAKFQLKYEREDNNQTSKFYVYDGENDSADKLIDFSTTSSVDNNFSAIFSTGRSIYIYCESFQDTYWNLDLTITLVPGIDHSVFISSDVIHGKVVSDKEVAKFHETVTLMVKPDEGYVLQCIEVTDDDGTVSMTPSSADVVFGDVNYYVSNEITFKMRSSDATVNATFMPKTDFYVNMPKTGQRDITIPADMTSFKLYDSGGKNSGYGKGENGDLLLTAPDGYVMNIKGSGTIRYYKEGIDASSVLCIYDGSSNSSEKIGEYKHTRQFTTDVDETSSFSVDKTSSGRQMLIHFESPSGGIYSYGNDNYSFTVTLIPTAATYSVTIADGITGGVVTADKANALEGDTVTLTVTPYEGYIVNSVTVNGNAADKVDDTRYTFTMPADDVTVTAVFKRVFADGIGEKLAGYSLSLDGDIGVNFYMELDQSVVNDTGAHMHFTLPDGSTSDVYLTDTDNCRIDTTTFPGKTYYVFKCNVAAKEMTDTIRAQIVLGNGSSGTLYEYSVKQYAEAITARESENTVLCNLVDAMLYFGTVSQNAFGHNTENPADGGKGYTGAVWNYNSSFEKPDLTNEGIEYYGSSLMLETKVSERHYFKVTGDINDFAFTIDGKSVVPVQYEGDPYYWYIQSDQIKAEDLGKSFKIEVIKGTKTIISYDYSPMDYVSLIFVKYDTTNNWHIQAKALYWYWKAAAAYRAAYPSQA